MFPEECFKNKQYGSVEIHQLQGATRDADGDIIVQNEEAFKVTQWMEKGVFDALEKEYLDTIEFSIFTKHPVTNADIILESYEFSVKYNENGEGPSINNVKFSSKNCIKNQAAKFIRSLTEFSSTLDKLPSNRWLTFTLKFNENTPEDYEIGKNTLFEYLNVYNDNTSNFSNKEIKNFSNILNTSSHYLPLSVNIGQLDVSDVNMRSKFVGLDSINSSLIDNLENFRIYNKSVDDFLSASSKCIKENKNKFISHNIEESEQVQHEKISNTNNLIEKDSIGLKKYNIINHTNESDKENKFGIDNINCNNINEKNISKNIAYNLINAM